MERKKFLRELKYLPKFLRDFHNQKDLFKRIDEIVFNAKEANKDDFLYKQLPGWTFCHIYVIDYFLWYMANCGYTLQRNRTRVDFIDYDKDMIAFFRRRFDAIKLNMQYYKEKADENRM